MATISLCADAGLCVVNLPMCNMCLQGRQANRTPRWRSLTPLDPSDRNQRRGSDPGRPQNRLISGNSAIAGIVS
jgi:hypothetical protein